MTDPRALADRKAREVHITCCCCDCDCVNSEACCVESGEDGRHDECCLEHHAALDAALRAAALVARLDEHMIHCDIPQPCKRMEVLAAEVGAMEKGDGS